MPSAFLSWQKQVVAGHHGRSRKNISTHLRLAMFALFAVLFSGSTSGATAPKGPSVTLISIEEKEDSIVVVFKDDPDIHTVVIQGTAKLSRETRNNLLRARALAGQQVKIHVVAEDQAARQGILAIDGPNSTVEITRYDPDRPAAWEYFESESGQIMIRGGIPIPPASGFTITRPIKMTL